MLVIVGLPILFETELDSESSRSDDVTVERADSRAIQVGLSNACLTVAAWSILRPVQLPTDKPCVDTVRWITKQTL